MLRRRCIFVLLIEILKRFELFGGVWEGADVMKLRNDIDFKNKQFLLWRSRRYFKNSDNIPGDYKTRAFFFTLCKSNVFSKALQNHCIEIHFLPHEGNSTPKKDAEEQGKEVLQKVCHTKNKLPYAIQTLCELEVVKIPHLW